MLKKTEETGLSITELSESLCPRLETGRFIIREFKRPDLTAFADYRADPDVAEYQSWTDYTYDDALKLFYGMDYSTFGRPGNWYQLAIEEKNTGRIIGDLAVHFVDTEKMEVGFTISAENQRKGVAFEALSRLLDYLFIELNKQKVVAFVDIRNVASYSLLEKTGFRRAAKIKADTTPQGGWGDEYFYVKLRAMHVSNQS